MSPPLPRFSPSSPWRSARGALILLALAWTAPPTSAATPDAEGWTQRQAEVQQRLDGLNTLIDDARARGVDTDYANVSVQTIRLFQQAAAWDRANVEDVRRIFKTFRHFDQTDPTEADRLAFNELKACIEVADYAEAELRRQLGGGLTLAPTPDFSRGDLELTPGTYRLDGQRVFPYTMFWLPTENDGVGDAFGRMGHTYLGLTYLDEAGDIDPASLKSRTASARRQSRDRFAPLKFFWGHIAPPWMDEHHPEMRLGGRNFTQYDTDSVDVRRYMTRLCEQFIPPMAEAYGDKPMIYMIANEPHFATAAGGWRVKNGLSENTNNRYRAWLEAKYETLARLNAAHDTSHERFADVPSPFPIAKNLRGGPVWYDWCRFNMDRINDWFTFLKYTIQSHDGVRKEPVTIKMLGHHLSDGARDHGMDIEHLVGLQDVTGGDLRVRPHDATVYTKLEGGMTASTSWTHRYAYEWVSQALFLDFVKSLAPEKVFYDTEWHGFGAVHWRRFNLGRPYVRAGIWHAFTHGMGAIEPWMWGRNPDGSFRESADQIGELATQPVALDAYGRVMKEINAHADLVAAAVDAPRTFMFFYVEESAIQDEHYATTLEHSYEAVKLLNHTMGLTTPTHLATLDPATQVVVVPPTRFVSDASLQTLSAFAAAGGRVVLVDADTCFRRDEMGNERGPHGIEAAAAVGPGEVMEMLPHFEAVLGPLAPKPAVGVAFTDADGGPAYGVLLQHAAHPETGVPHLVLNNSSRDARTVAIATDSTSPPLTDVLTGERLESPFVMPSCDVRLVRVGP